MIINLAGGTGMMGRTHKPLFEAAGHRVIISGRETSPGLEEAAELADVTIISVPIPATEEIIKKIAPCCRAIMDFTGIKIQPMRAMYDFAPEGCEIQGLHPLYREFYKGATIVSCPTKRSRERCGLIVSTLRKAGAKIKVMTPEEHDKYMDKTQNQRALMLKKYVIELSQEMSVGEAYKLSSKPTKIVLDLVARQIDEANGNLYDDMIEHNLFTKHYEKTLSSEEIRRWFGKQLKPAQKRAERYVQMS